MKSKPITKMAEHRQGQRDYSGYVWVYVYDWELASFPFLHRILEKAESFLVVIQDKRKWRVRHWE